ncbi:MAG: TRAP transporter permease [Spirochaetaceae bacterium]|nr:TRAP transporter permease [Spirochaetaceae bacterium]
MTSLLKSYSPFASVPPRRFEGILATVVVVLTAGTSLIHCWMNTIGVMMSIKMNALHLGTLMAITYLLYPAFPASPRHRPSITDWLFSGLSLGTAAYVLGSYDRILSSNMVLTSLDYAVAITICVLLVEASRRSIGMPLTILSLAFLAYARFGRYFPGLFAHRGFNWDRILLRMVFTDEGIYGTTLSVSATYVFMFILFGSFLAATHTSELFNDLALALAGKFRGGPAKVSVIASALMGTISGSAQANVATTGAFTIPLMKRIGYPDFFAGAVEASASTGGILMPPIMGATAFIMSSFLGVPYSVIMLAGFAPAILYFLGIFFMVDLQAKKQGMKGLAPEEVPSLRKTMKERGHMLLPLAFIMYMLVSGYTPLFSAMAGLIAIIVLSSFRKTTRMRWKDVIGALDDGAKSAAPVAVSCAIVGFIVGSVGMTGLGQVVALNIMEFSGGHLWVALVLAMVASLILGMGLPSTACYIVVATIAVPAMLSMGVPPLAAHFFAFYYGTMSGIVPPVALTSFTAAGLSGGKPSKVAVVGLGLASSGLILPFFFVYNPVLLGIEFSVGRFIYLFLLAALGIFALSTSFIGTWFSKMSIVERAAFFILGVLLVDPVGTVRLAAIGGFVVLAVVHYLLSRKRNAPAGVAAAG